MIALSISTQARCELRDITAEIRSLVARWADERQRRDGALLLFSPHTTCGLTINEGADPDVRRDMVGFFGRLVPQFPERFGAPAFAHAEESSARQERKGVILDTAAAQIRKGEEKRELTKNEVKILYCLFRHQGEFVSRTDLIDELWDDEVFIDDNTLSVNITRIRGKLREIGAEDFIETRRGLGYRI